ncbi:MAG: hypothetical protein CK425_10290 [Parachlamydia sp.]|nr:MAG: hypothetical protein CK425_10290 [Parachlamydia sp.]
MISLFQGIPSLADATPIPPQDAGQRTNKTILGKRKRESVEESEVLSSIWSKIKVLFTLAKKDFAMLPPEILEKIFFCLPGQDLITAKLACRKWCEVISNPAFCKRFVEAYVPDFYEALVPYSSPSGEEWCDALRTAQIKIIQQKRIRTLKGRIKRIDNTEDVLAGICLSVIVISLLTLGYHNRESLYEIFKAMDSAAKKNPEPGIYTFRYDTIGNIANS